MNSVVGKLRATCSNALNEGEIIPYDETHGDTIALNVESDDTTSTKLDGPLIHNPVNATDDYSTETLYAACGNEHPLLVLKHNCSHEVPGREALAHAYRLSTIDENYKKPSKRRGYLLHEDSTE